MAKLSRTIDVERPIADTFRYVLDFTNAEQWDANVLTANKTTPGPLGVGACYTIEAKSGLKVVKVDYEVLKVEENSRIELKGVAPGITLEDTILFTPFSEHQTRIQYDVKISVDGMIGAVADRFEWIFSPMMDRAISGLKRALDDADEPPKLASRVADRLIVPGLLQFTRFGYRQSKARWKGLSQNLQGKYAIVTGATSGLGRSTVMSLVRMGADVLAVARDEAKAKQLLADVQSECGQTSSMGQLDYALADLSLMQDVKKLADSILAEGRAIDILINNAGALFNERTLTAEGLESSFALLLLSPFMLTEMLIPLLLKASQARVINVSSGGMYAQRLLLDDLQNERKGYDGTKAYARAKRGLVDITEVWAKRYVQEAITFNVMHPGWSDTPAVSKSLPMFYKITKPVLRTPREGADTIVWLASAKELAEVSGKFWLDRKAHSTAVIPGTRTRAEQQEQLFECLMAWSEPGKVLKQG